MLLGFYFITNLLKTIYYIANLMTLLTIFILLLHIFINNIDILNH